MFFQFLSFFILFNICIDVSFSVGPTFQKQLSNKEKSRENEARKKSIEYHTNELEKSQNNLNKAKEGFKFWFRNYKESTKSVPFGHTNREAWLKQQEKRNNLRISFDNNAKPLKVISLLHTTAPSAARQLFSDRADLIHSAYKGKQQEMDNLSKTGKHNPDLVLHHQQQVSEVRNKEHIIPGSKHERDIEFHKDAIDSHQKAINKNEQKILS